MSVIFFVQILAFVCFFLLSLCAFNGILHLLGFSLLGEE
uniref:Uncharacterized protein n=1 Tax=Rhizophora mucronata TaxID=61149 RepID=A0A2P2PLB5_RHIMU